MVDSGRCCLESNRPPFSPTCPPLDVFRVVLIAACVFGDAPVTACRRAGRCPGGPDGGPAAGRRPPDREMAVHGGTMVVVMLVVT